MQYRRPESVLVLIHTPAAEVLLLNRVTPNGFWQSVTGSLEPGELPVQTAGRELTEETGITGFELIDCEYSSRFAIRQPWLRKYVPGTTHNLEHVFRCVLPARVDTIKLASDEHSEFLWLPLPQAMDKVSSHTNRDALQRFVPVP